MATEPKSPQRSGARPSGPRRDSSRSGGADDTLTQIGLAVLVLALLFSSISSVWNSRAFRSMYVRIFPQESLSYYDSATGARVHVSGDVGNVREEPGGLRIGSQSRGATGEVAGGPVTAIDRRFWLVDFDTGVDGWVAENEILLVRPQTFVSRVAGVVGSFLRVVSTLLSLVFLTGIIYSVIRRSQVLTQLYQSLRMRESPAVVMASAEAQQNRRWERVLAHVQSESPSDWRLAVLESDIILSELLEKMGYAGENVGERLKTIERSDFETIDDAWEAHKIRNLIAHQGSDYILSKREAQRVVGLYANVFREFRYI